jgi:hypothetical protein
LGGFGGEVRGDNILNLVCLVQFFKRGGEVILCNFLFPPNWGDLEGRGGKLKYYFLY